MASRTPGYPSPQIGPNSARKASSAGAGSLNSRRTYRALARPRGPGSDIADGVLLIILVMLGLADFISNAVEVIPRRMRSPGGRSDAPGTDKVRKEILWLTTTHPLILSHPLRTLVRMQVIDPGEIMKGFRRVDLRAARADELRGALDDIRCVRARLDRIEAEIARRLETVTGTPERDVAKGAQRSNRHGAKVMARAATLANTPELSDALDAGDLGGDHVDVFAKVLGALDGPVKARLAEAAPGLIEQAATSGSTPEEFATSLNTAAEQITADGGLSRLDRQRRATRLRTWTDRATGMWRLSGSFDPESGARIHGRLEAAMAAMFATKTPSTAPTDAGEKQDHLRALALLALTKGVVGSKAPPAGSKAPPAGSKAQPAGPSGPEPTHDGTTDQPTSPDEWDEFAAEVGTASTRFGRPECVFVIDTTNLGPTASQPLTGASPSPSPGHGSKTSVPTPPSDR